MKSLDQFAVNPALFFVRSNKGGGEKGRENGTYGGQEKCTCGIGGKT